MQDQAATVATPPAPAEEDITFACSQCREPLVVKAAAAGLNLNCKRCGKLTAIPKPSKPAATSPDKLADIQRHMKENESQRIEITGYINQLSIQLHRWQLRLQTLDERRKQLEGDLRKASGSSPGGPARSGGA